MSVLRMHGGMEWVIEVDSRPHPMNRKGFRGKGGHYLEYFYCAICGRVCGGVGPSAVNFIYICNYCAEEAERLARRNGIPLAAMPKIDDVEEPKLIRPPGY